MNEFPRIQIGGYARIQSGYSFRSADWVDEGIPVVKIGNVKCGRIDRAGLGYVDDSVAHQAKHFSLADGDVLMAMTGYVGEMAVVRAVDVPLLLNQRVGRCEPTSQVLNKSYMYYALSSPDARAQLESLAQGSAQPNLSAKDFGLVEIHLAPISEQRAIAGVLGALDDKIESNRRTASTCIQLAQLLLSAGNEQIRVGQCAVIEKGLSYKGAGLAEKGSGTPMFNLGNFGTSGWLDRTSTKYYSGGFKERHTVRTGDLIVANTDLTQQRVILGRPALVPPLPGTGIITHHVFAVRCQIPAIRLALWAQLNGSRFRERAEGYATGTTVASMPPDALADFVLEVPRDSEVAEAESLIERAWAAESESETLAATRDTLLPELLSGRLRVRDVEDRLEVVA